MELEFKSREKIVGLFLFLVILLALATVVSIGRGKGWFKSYVTFHTVFEESYNLQKGAGVKIAKTTIGQVRDVTLTDRGVRVDLAIQEEYASRIRQETLATVESPTFIGDEYVSIKPGRQDVPRIPDDGPILSIEKKSISEILDEFQVEKTAKKLIAAVQRLSDTADTIASPQGPLFEGLASVNTTLKHVESILASVAQGEGTLGGLVRSDDLLKEAQASMRKVDEILATIQKAADQAPPTAGEVRQSARELAEIGKQLQEATGEIVATVKEIVKNVRNGSKRVPEITEQTRYGIKEFRRGMKKFVEVADAIKANPLVRATLTPEPEGEPTESGMRVR
ncbi:MAG: MCE family protein [Proteobacteria bacterium]|nr:MCE family protein [Pseudomonadota bacterium]